MKTQISIKMEAILGVSGIAAAGFLARTAKGVVSLVSKIFPLQTQKAGVRGVQKTSRLGAIFKTPGIGKHRLTPKRISLAGITAILITATRVGDGSNVTRLGNYSSSTLSFLGELAKH